MLYRKTVASELLALLDQLMTVEALHDLRLVGGTALALQIGHRESVDIDLFGRFDIEDDHLKDILSSIGETNEINISRSIKQFYVNNVKLDIVNYRYAWLDPTVLKEGIRMASLKDIAAMKLSAITQRGSKKDFIDLYYLLQYFSIADIFSIYLEKITDGNHWLAHRSLTYFTDADQQPTPRMYNDVSWEDVKTHIVTEVKRLSKI